MGSCCRGFRAVFKPNNSSNSRVSINLPLRPSSDVSDGLPRPPRVLASEDEGHDKVLAVQEVDLCLKTNSIQHHTEQYYAVRRENKPQLIIRRGQPFQVDITLSRGYDQKTDAVSFVFRYKDAKTPSYGQRTFINIPLLTKIKHSAEEWSVLFLRSSENVISVQITPSANCIVGEWNMEIDSKLINGNPINYTHKESFYIIFNPWCKDDQVYLEDKMQCKEYVLADTGLIWRGTASRMQPSVWKYAQFEKDVLECCLYVLTDIRKLPPSSCADVVKVARALSAGVNSPDDYGILMGNWTGDFGGGTPPSKWIGSMKIIQKYYKEKKPVKYGQCWVFGGVLTTVCRALGIPCRTVTTYSAAHDTHNSLTIDYFVDENGHIMEELNSDSIWNFHVWNEVWMSRPDLSNDKKYGGWQVIDSTPQELSDEVYRVGPASVYAVKTGDVAKPYDTGFVFSEVNADVVFWRFSGYTQPLKLLRKDTVRVGQSMCTKAIETWTKEDVTSNYKHQEKSDKERDTMLRALRQNESLYSRYYLNEEFNDIKFDFLLRDDIVIGQSFSVVLLMKNKASKQDHTVTVTLRVDTVLYTGKVKDPVKKEKFVKTIKAGTDEEVKINVTWEEYSKKLIDQCAFNIACMATVQDTNYEYFAQDDFRVRKPDIKIKLDNEPITGQELTGNASLINPLPISLKKGKFVIEGPGLDHQYKVKLTQNVEPKEEIKAPFKLIPQFPGKGTIVAKFVSKELDDVDGYFEFTIHEKPQVEVNGTGINNTIIP
ncbi:transglutaminase [Lycorma delicatula]|uniref:transglutaminase n=1 Tax=Lycorma delicatula TaxID=130591 RepID=UPI003F50F97F